MKDLQSATESELLAELESRKKPKLPVPTPVAKPDFSALIKMMEEVKEKSMADGYEDDDFKHYIYEMAIEAVYGKSYWQWRREQIW